MWKPWYVVMLCIVAFSCDISAPTLCHAAPTAQIRISLFGDSPVIEICRSRKLMFIRFENRLPLESARTIKLQPGTRLSVSVEKGYEPVELKWGIGTAATTVNLTTDSRQQHLCICDDKQSIVLVIKKIKGKNTDCTLTIEPTGFRNYTPLVSYIFANKAKPTYGMTQPLSSIGTVFNQPLFFGTAVGVSDDNQQSFIGGAVMTRLYSGSRYDEEPSSGLPFELTVAVGIRGVKFGEGNPGNELFYGVGLSLFQRPIK